MSLYIEWSDPYSGKIPSKMKVKHIVRVQFDREPRYSSAKQAIQDFWVMSWGRFVIENENDELYYQELLT